MIFNNNQNTNAGGLFGNQNPIKTNTGGNIFGNNLQQQAQVPQLGQQIQQNQQGNIFQQGQQTQLGQQTQQGQQLQPSQTVGVQQSIQSQTVHSQAWKEMKELYQRLSNVKKETISVERDINVSDNNNKYAHKPVCNLPDPIKTLLGSVNETVQTQEKEISKILDKQKDLFNQVQETRKTIQQSSLQLKQTAQQVKDIQETVNELITEQQDQKQYITNFFYTFTNYLENRQFPRILLPQPFIVQAQEKFQLKLEKLQRQINEVEQILQVEILKRNDEEDLAFIFVIIEQLFKYFNNVTALVYEFHKNYESFRMKIVHLQDQREFGFVQDLDQTTKQSLDEENRYFKQLSGIYENLEKQIRKHDEEQAKHVHDKRYTNN